jgi:hypothetical protein
MASYIQGSTDYIPQAQPWTPDYNFLGNVLQNAQSKYDQNYKQLSKTYGTLLNSPMLREDNNAQRDEFFKMIDNDIKKISGMDLSLQQNVDAANTVFDSFYQNKEMVKDMVYTKNYQKQIEIGDSYKNCLDEAQCGGQYWEEGMRALQYGAEEFKTASREQTLSMSNKEFTPFINVHEKAIKLAKEADLNVTQDIDTGKWIITKKNGELIQGGLYALFNNALGSDPKIKDMYSTSAYVKRKDFSQMYAEEFGSAENAEREYINNLLGNATASIEQEEVQINNASDQMNARRAELLEKQKTTGLTYAERDALFELEQTLPAISETQNNIKTTKNTVNNTAAGDDINVLRSRADAAAAYMLSQYDFTNAAQVLSLKGAEMTMKENPYAFASHQSSLSLRNQMTMAEINRQNDLERLQFEHDLSIDKAQFDYNLEAGFLDGISDLKEAGSQILPSGTVELVNKPNESYATATLTDENISTPFELNQAKARELLSLKAQDQVAFLKDAIRAVNNTKGNSPGAKQFIDQVYNLANAGKPGQKNVSVEQIANEIAKDPTLLDKIYTATTDTLLTPCSTCDNSWAQGFIRENTERIQNINIQKQATDATIKYVTESNTEIINSIKGQSSFESKDDVGKRPDYYKDADLAMKSGFLVSKDSFVQDYVNKHASDEYYTNFVQANGKIYKYSQTPNGDWRNLGEADPKYTGVEKRSILDDATEAYELITEKFYETFNSRGSMIDQGFGLKGGSTIHANVQLAPNVDAAKWGSPIMQQVNSEFKVFNANASQLKFGIGAPTADNLKNAVPRSNNTAYQNLFTTLTRDLNTKYKAGQAGRPIFSYEMSPIAGNNPNAGARTLYFDPEYIKKLKGTKENPTELAELDLESGFTIYYGNQDINLDNRSQESKNLDLIARYGDGIKYDIPNGGNLTIKADEQTGQYKVDGSIIRWDNNVKVKADAFVQTWPQGTNIELINNEIKNILYTIEQSNFVGDQQAAYWNSLGYPIQGYIPPTQNQ